MTARRESRHLDRRNSGRLHVADRLSGMDQVRFAAPGPGATGRLSVPGHVTGGRVKILRHDDGWIIGHSTLYVPEEHEELHLCWDEWLGNLVMPVVVTGSVPADRGTQICMVPLGDTRRTEQRRHARVDVFAPLTLATLDKTVDGTTLNLSAGGARAMIDERVPLRTASAHLRLPGLRISLAARLLACDVEDDMCTVRMQWMNTSPLDRSRLTTFVIAAQQSVSFF